MMGEKGYVLTKNYLEGKKLDKVARPNAVEKLKVFKGYYTVRTPRGGYHIYLKVKSKDKFNYQYLSTLEGENTTIQLLGKYTLVRPLIFS